MQLSSFNLITRLWEKYFYYPHFIGEQGEASLVAQTVKNLPAVQETGVWSLGGEDPLEKEMAAHSSILAWKTPWTEKPGGLQSWGHKESDTERLHFPT